MPMHDWTCVSAGTYHDFHNSWITHLKETFNAGLLPPAYYALGEQRSGDIGPDVVTEEVRFYLQRRRTLVIRHSSGDRVVALIEIVSPANKHTHRTIEAFADKLVAALRDGIHVLVIDPFPPTRHDPEGMHGVIWERILAGDYQHPHDLSLSLVSYCVRRPITAYVEPFCVGSKLVDMPLFLTPELYIPAPLESTYMQAWAGVPNRWRRVIEQET